MICKKNKHYTQWRISMKKSGIINQVSKILLITISFVSCISQKPSDESINESYNAVNSVVIDGKVKDSVEFELRDISENLRIIGLQTSDSVLIGNIYNVVLGDNYLIVGTENDDFLFDKNGVFIRKLLRRGRGPDEFIFPQLSTIIKNDIIYLADRQKSDKYIYYINLPTGEQGRIPKAMEGDVSSLIPDTDSTLLMTLTDYFYENNSTSLMYYLVRQDFNGDVLTRIPLGSYTGRINRIPSFSNSIFVKKPDILICTPRCDSILRLSSLKLSTVWRNNYLTPYDEELYAQSGSEAHLIHFSEDSVFFWRGRRTYMGNMAIGPNVEFVLMDRLNNKLVAVKTIFFLDRNKPINVARIFLLENDQFALPLQATDVIQMLSNPVLKESLEKIIISSSSIDPVRITAFDNPLILIGKFR